MSAGCEDYDFWDYSTTFAAVYIGLGVISLVLNFDIIALIIKSRRLVGSPKYWPVLIVSAAFIFQSAVPNSILSAKWLSGEKTQDNIWIMSFIFNKYIGLGAACWGSFLVNLDYVLCMKSASYTRYYRIKTMLFLIIIIWTCLIAGVIAAYFFKDEDSTERTIIFGTGNNQILLWATCFAPLLLSMSSCGVIVVWKCSRKLRKIVSRNRDVSSSVDVGDCPHLPPSDHVTFLLILVMFYVPGTILSYEPMTDLCSSVLTFRKVVQVLRDNAGCVASLSWFLYKDIRISCKHCFTKGDNMLPTSVQDSPEMNMYDTYPYCKRMQI